MSTHPDPHGKPLHTLEDEHKARTWAKIIRKRLDEHAERLQGDPNNDAQRSTHVVQDPDP